MPDNPITRESLQKQFGQTQPSSNTTAQKEVEYVPFEMPDGQTFEFPAGTPPQTALDHILDSDYGSNYPEFLEKREEKRQQKRVELQDEMVSAKKAGDFRRGVVHYLDIATEGAADSALGKFQGYEPKGLAADATFTETMAYMIPSTVARLPEYIGGAALGGAALAGAAFVGVTAPVWATAAAGGAFVAGTSFAVADTLNGYLDRRAERGGILDQPDFYQAIDQSLAIIEDTSRGYALGMATGMGGSIGRAAVGAGAKKLGMKSVVNKAAGMTEKELESNLLRATKEVGQVLGETAGFGTAQAGTEHRMPVIYDYADAGAVIGTLFAARSGIKLKPALARIRAEHLVRQEVAKGKNLKKAVETVLKDEGIDPSDVSFEVKERNFDLKTRELRPLTNIDDVVQTTAELNKNLAEYKRIHQEIFGVPMGLEQQITLSARDPYLKQLLELEREDARIRQADRQAAQAKGKPVGGFGDPNAKGTSEAGTAFANKARENRSVDVESKLLDEGAESKKRGQIGFESNPPDAAIGDVPPAGTVNPEGGRPAKDVMDAIWGSADEGVDQGLSKNPELDFNADLDPIYASYFEGGDVNPTNPFDRYENLPKPVERTPIPEGVVAHSGPKDPQRLWDWFQQNPEQALDMLHNAADRDGYPSRYNIRKNLGISVDPKSIPDYTDIVRSTVRPEPLQEIKPKAQRRAEIEADLNKGLTAENATIDSLMEKYSGEILGTDRDGTHILLEHEGMSHTLVVKEGDQVSDVLAKLADKHTDLLDGIQENGETKARIGKDSKNIPRRASDPIIQDLIETMQNLANKLGDLITSGKKNTEAFKVTEEAYRKTRKALTETTVNLQNAPYTYYSESQYNNMTKEQLSVIAEKRGIQVLSKGRETKASLTEKLLASDEARFGDLKTFEQDVALASNFYSKSVSEFEEVVRNVNDQNSLTRTLLHQIDVQRDVAKAYQKAFKILSRGGKDTRKARAALSYFNALRNVGENANIAAAHAAELLTGTPINFVLPAYLNKINPFRKALLSHPLNQSEINLLNEYLAMKYTAASLRKDPSMKVGGLTAKAAEARMKDIRASLSADDLRRIEARVIESDNIYNSILARFEAEGMITKGERESILQFGIDPTLVYSIAEGGANPAFKESMEGLYSRGTQGLKEVRKGGDTIFPEPIVLAQAAAANAETAVLRNKATRALAELIDENGEAMGMRRAKIHPDGTQESVSPTSGMASINYFENGEVRRLIVPESFAKDWNYHGFGEGMTSALAWLNVLSGTWLKKQSLTGFLAPLWVIPQNTYELGHKFLSASELGDRAYSANAIKYTGQMVKDLAVVSKELAFGDGNLALEHIQHGGRGPGMWKAEISASSFGGDKLTLKDFTLANKKGFVSTMKRGKDNLIGTMTALSNASQFVHELAEAHRMKKNIASREGKSVADLTEAELMEAHTYPSRRMAYRDSGPALKFGEILRPYIAAGIQSTRPLFRNIRENPKAASAQIAQLMLAGFGLTMANLYMNADLHQELQEYEAGNFVLTFSDDIAEGKDEDGNPAKAYAVIKMEPSARLPLVMGEAMAYATMGIDYNYKRMTDAARMLASIPEIDEINAPLLTLIAMLGDEPAIRNSVTKGLQLSDSPTLNKLMGPNSLYSALGMPDGQNFMSPEQAERLFRDSIGRNSLIAMGLKGLDDVFGPASPLSKEEKQAFLSLPELAKTPVADQVFKFTRRNAETVDLMREVSFLFNNARLRNENQLSRIIIEVEAEQGVLSTGNPKIKEFLQGIDTPDERKRMMRALDRFKSAQKAKTLLSKPDVPYGRYKEFKDLVLLDGAQAGLFYATRISNNVSPEDDLELQKLLSQTEDKSWFNQFRGMYTKIKTVMETGKTPEQLLKLIQEQGGIENEQALQNLIKDQGLLTP